MIALKEDIEPTSLEIFSSGNCNDDFLRSITIEVRAGFINTNNRNEPANKLPSSFGLSKNSTENSVSNIMNERLLGMLKQSFY